MKKIILLQLAVILYTVSGIMAKFASGGKTVYYTLLFLGLDVLFLGIYAIVWQQLIKRFELSVAYANRAMALLWSAVWALLIFHEALTWKKVLGIAFVILGTLIVNTERSKGK